MRKCVNPFSCKKSSQDKKKNNNKRRLFSDYGDDDAVVDDQVRFLARIYKKCPRDSNLFLAFRRKRAKQWIEKSVRRGEIKSNIRQLLTKYARWNYDLYFCPNAFSKLRRKTKFAEKTVWAWCDIDGSDPKLYRPRPSLLWLTSPKRYQGLWLFDRLLKPQKAEAYSRALTYNFGGDPGGWSVTKYLRIPGSINHKPEYNKPVVTLLRQSWKPLCERPDMLPEETRRESSSNRQLVDIGPMPENTSKIVRRLRPRMCLRTRNLVASSTTFGSDRSKCIFMMVAGLKKAGATPEEIAAILWGSPFFLEKHGKNRSKLHEEVSRILCKVEGKT